jgi:hypothetical protein
LLTTIGGLAPEPPEPKAGTPAYSSRNDPAAVSLFYLRTISVPSVRFVRGFFFGEPEKAIKLETCQKTACG